ncbi:non-hydrolyzing UDP-N-acetylglucosamine 2-epimerase [Thermodesulfobacteriota bacterium]
MLKISTIVGARPQFIKAAPVSRAIARHNEKSPEAEQVEEIIIHTGQHYDENMSKIFFDELHIPRPNHNLGIGSDTHGRQTGRMLAGIEDILIEENPQMVLTYGDTNSTLAGALAAVKLHIPSAHVEAGLRSYNRKMPEEINRVVTDEISNILFCPTEAAVMNLKSEGISDEFSGDRLSTASSGLPRIVANVGDVMHDSILYNKQLARTRSDILKKLFPDGGDIPDYCLVTVHRPENTDNEKILREIFAALRNIAGRGVIMILPLHPRTRKTISEFGLNRDFNFLEGLEAEPDNRTGAMNPTNSIALLNPVSYLDMIQLESTAKAVFTDSGGVQKEAYLLGVPCVTLRNETEWVETVNEGWNILTGPHVDRIENAFTLISKWTGKEPPFNLLKEEASNNSFHTTRKCPYGDGTASEKIIEILLKFSTADPFFSE